LEYDGFSSEDLFVEFGKSASVLWTEIESDIGGEYSQKIRNLDIDSPRPFGFIQDILIQKIGRRNPVLRRIRSAALLVRNDRAISRLVNRFAEFPDSRIRGESLEYFVRTHIERGELP